MSNMRVSYGFSSLFEAMEINSRRIAEEDTLFKFAAGAMESSLLGDDVVGALGENGDITGPDDYDYLDEDDLSAEDKEFLDSIPTDDEDIGEETLESLNVMLESSIESEMYGGY